MMAGKKAPGCAGAATLAGWDLTTTVHIFLVAVMVIVTARVLPTIGADLRPPYPTIRTVNPNAAPWYELTVLPRIGEGIAREIVHYRESALGSGVQGEAAQAVFSSVADLDAVRGIGPITVRRIAPYLRFTDE